MIGCPEPVLANRRGNDFRFIPRESRKLRRVEKLYNLVYILMLWFRFFARTWQKSSAETPLFF